ncbi:Sugar kinase, ribokinase [Frankia sp. AiPs1]|uniref:PfkB family carbohydrate kinase n=1 Tax=Frankia sp. AiPa1 TaxID=573492 RepID=UPI00202B8BAE|nr:PfkB family carbohydrate kinase [Frankia sp. AiPa1]MCL9758291.1 PfkB family carbohydrate kinase [Frankia sp. AiPa1]
MTDDRTNGAVERNVDLDVGDGRPLGLFVGLSTFDAIYRVRSPPNGDEKIVADALVTAAGGPATGAAVTFAHLGGRAVLLSAVGTGPLAEAVRSELATLGVEHLDLSPNEPALPVSSIMISTPGGQRAVVSAHGQQETVPEVSGVPGTGVPRDRARDGRPGRPAAGARRTALGLLAQAAVVLVDGHQAAVAEEVLTALSARADPRRRPLVVFDGGSWKPGTQRLLAHVDAAVCSAAFHPPTVTRGGTTDRLRYLLAHGPSFAAVTAGAEAIRWADARGGAGEIRPPAVPVVDTLGAGDVLHGAFAWALARSAHSPDSAGPINAGPINVDPAAALAAATQVAARSIGSFGTREWMGQSGSSRSGSSRR